MMYKSYISNLHSIIDGKVNSYWFSISRTLTHSICSSSFKPYSNGYDLTFKQRQPAVNRVSAEVWRHPDLRTKSQRDYMRHLLELNPPSKVESNKSGSCRFERLLCVSDFDPSQPFNCGLDLSLCLGTS